MTAKKMKIADWINQEFLPDSAPTASTVRRWIANGHIQGEQIGNLWFVLVDSKNQKSTLINKVIGNVS